MDTHAGTSCGWRLREEVGGVVALDGYLTGLTDNLGVWPYHLFHAVWAWIGSYLGDERSMRIHLARLSDTLKAHIVAPDHDSTAIAPKGTALIYVADDDFRRRDHDAFVIAEVFSFSQTVEDVYLNLLHLSLLLAYLFQILRDTVLQILKGFFPIVEYYIHKLYTIYLLL